VGQDHVADIPGYRRLSMANLDNVFTGRIPPLVFPPRRGGNPRSRYPRLSRQSRLMILAVADRRSPRKINHRIWRSARGARVIRSRKSPALPERRKRNRERERERGGRGREGGRTHRNSNAKERSVVLTRHARGYTHTHTHTHGTRYIVPSALSRLFFGAAHIRSARDNPALCGISNDFRVLFHITAAKHVGVKGGDGGDGGRRAGGARGARISGVTRRIKGRINLPRRTITWRGLWRDLLSSQCHSRVLFFVRRWNRMINDPFGDGAGGSPRSAAGTRRGIILSRSGGFRRPTRVHSPLNGEGRGQGAEGRALPPSTGNSIGDRRE